MLAKLFGKKSDHPMSDMKSAQALLAELPKEDDYKCLMELTDWMESVTSQTEFKLDHQLALIFLIDETAYSYTRKLSHEYFVAHELSPFQENRLWLVLSNWYRQSRIGHFLAFSRYYEEGKLLSSLKSKLPLLSARTLRTLTLEMKFVCVRYTVINPSVWIMLGQLYKHAEREQYLDTQIALYPALPKLTSVNLEAGHLLAWYGCGVSALSPLDMHITERLLAHVYTLGCVQLQPSTHSLFGFDLNAARPPHRVNVDATVHPHMRFIGLADMVPPLVKLLAVLEKNIVPDDLILGGEYQAGAVKPAVEFLLRCIVEQPKRAAPRRMVDIKLNVIMGCEQILQQGGFDGQHEAKPDEWQIKDISPLGFHALLPTHAGREVKIGQMCAIQATGVSHWGVAVVRRLMRAENGQMHVGAVILSSQVKKIALRTIAGGVQHDLTALWLTPKSGADDAEVDVLLPSGRYQATWSYDTDVAGKRLLLLPKGVLQKNLECDWVRFRAVEQSTAEPEEA
jgi:hypothetical protein